MLHILFFVLLSGARALKLTNTLPSTQLLPNTDNKLAPFTLTAEAGEDAAASLTLAVTCSEAVRAGVAFSGQAPNICTTESLKGTPEQLNELLQSTYARPRPQSTKSDAMQMVYTISRGGSSAKPLVFTQSLTVASFLPIQRVNRVIYFEPSTATSFNLKILEIPQSYYANAAGHEFEVIMSEALPAWIGHNFLQNELYFSGTTPKDLGRSYTFMFTVRDKQSGLTSENINVDVENSVAAQTADNKAVIIVVFLIFTGIIACILLIILISSKKRSASPVALQRANENNETRPFDRNSTLVLSDSIVNWNKRMVERLKTKNFDFNETEDGNSSPTRVPGYAYEQFDESYELSEENKSPMKMSDKLSEIRPDEQTKDRSDGDRSSFLDEIRFKFN